MLLSRAGISSVEGVLLDTQVVIRAYLGFVLPKKIEMLLSSRELERYVSVASILEIAIKQAAGKIVMAETHFHEAVRDLALTVLPLTARHAYRMFSLPLHHRDPFDRAIIATALVENLPLVGGDRQFRRYHGVKVIW